MRAANLLLPTLSLLAAVSTAPASTGTFQYVSPRPGARLVALIKPQFEVGKNRVGKRGVVRDPRLHEQVCTRIRSWLDSKPHWQTLGIVTSPIRGPEGNTEFLIAAARDSASRVHPVSASIAGRKTPKVYCTP